VAEQAAALGPAFWPVVQALSLLLVANGSPVLATRLLGRRGAWPIDGGQSLEDGRRLLGPAKTWRGVCLAVLATGTTAPLLGLPWSTGAWVGLWAMAGDLGSSFVKRRMGMASSTMAPGLDQLPEALLPLLVCRDALGLTLTEAFLAAALFWLADSLLSPLLHRLGIRKRPY
jgi:CDP-2,3-bis-(O-geranylgeranyl)-sn-glycerol synthase